MSAPPAAQWGNRVGVGAAWRSWEELAAEALGGDAGVPIAVICEELADPWRALAAAVAGDLDLLLVDDARVDAELNDVLKAAGYRIVRSGRTVAEAAAAPAAPGRITVLSSGTTGRPRLVKHTLASLATVRAADAPPRRWLCPYSPGTYAWFQCAVLGLTVPGQDVVPVAPDEPDAWVQTALRFEVTAISATPTFWRRSLLAVPGARLRALPLAQLSLGGEPVDQALLDRLRDLYPAARLTHIYASSEAGACIAVSDGRAGFPHAWLATPRPSGVELRVEGDRLFVRSPHASTSHAGGWIDTGDRVRVADGRVEVVGRVEERVINVGGVKVSAEQVAGTLAAHPAVAWSRVRPKRAPIVGELPVAEVALAAGAEASEDALIAWCRERLPEVAVPRLVRFRDDVPTTAALKAAER